MLKRYTGSGMTRQGKDIKWMNFPDDCLTWSVGPWLISQQHLEVQNELFINKNADTQGTICLRWYNQNFQLITVVEILCFFSNHFRLTIQFIATTLHFLVPHTHIARTRNLTGPWGRLQRERTRMTYLAGKGQRLSAESTPDRGNVQRTKCMNTTTCILCTSNEDDPLPADPCLSPSNSLKPRELAPLQAGKRKSDTTEYCEHQSGQMTHREVIHKGNATQEITHGKTKIFPAALFLRIKSIKN